jgi:SAM-dependent methyltransferase
MKPPPMFNKNKNGIATELLRLGLVREDRIKIISHQTRDRADLPVYRDEISKIIFIDNHYVGDDVYKSGDFRNNPKPLMTKAGREFEDNADSERRIKQYKQFIIGNNICDFGCGAGSFLRMAKPYAKNMGGVELNESYSIKLNLDGITCRPDINEIAFEIDTAFLFHSFEHFPEPLDMLKKIHKKLKSDGGGKIIIEVPHAKDFLMERLELGSYIDFTLWSQHLILHTRESLMPFLKEAGFKSVLIEGVQRYGLSNHLHWLKMGRPGGHKSELSLIETDALVSSYADALSKLDANDTLVAIATT